jgi:hypothetical protein
MFGFLKKKHEPVPDYLNSRGFISLIFEKIRLIKNPNDRLDKYIALHEILIQLEVDFGEECLELDLARDAIRDAFLESDDPQTMSTNALAYDLLGKKLKKEITRIMTSDLQDHLKARLIRTHIISELDEVNVDPIELDPELQHAFFEVEERGLNDIEKSKVLKLEFGIEGWRNEREMNPHIIYD